MLTIMEYVRKEDSEENIKEVFSCMTKYEYKVLTESDHRTLEYTLNSYGSAGWKLVNVVWNNDESFLITTLIREKE